MAKHNFNAALASAPGRYHKAKRGGNKELVNSCECHSYNNDYLLSKEYIVSKHKTTTKINKVMATKNLLESSLGSAVMASVRKGMFKNFMSGLVDSLSSSCSCGVGRMSYAALVAAWRKDTANCGFALNESEGRKLYAADPADPRLRRIGEEGHWSWFVAPAACENKEDSERKETDSIAVLVGAWIKSWSSWYESVVQYGHYGEGGVPAGSCVSAGLLNRCKDLWSYRGVGGRTAATTAERAQKKVAKAAEGLSPAELLAALKASGADLSALAALAAGGASAGNSESANKD